MSISAGPDSTVDDRLHQPLAHASAGRSAVRQRQLRWVAGELTRWWATDAPPQLSAAPAFPASDLHVAPAPLRALFSPTQIDTFLAVADQGHLRARTHRHDQPGHPHPSSVASAQARRDALKLLTTAAGFPHPMPPALPPTVRPRLPGRTTLQVLSALSQAALAPHARPHDTRAAVIVMLVVRHGLRTGELAALTLTDLTLPTSDGSGAPGTLRWTPCSPHTGPGPLRTATLSPSEVTLLAAWLVHRSWFAQPRSRHLLLTLHAGHDGAGRTRPVGLALQPRGLVRAHARTIDQLNTTGAGQPGHTPLPRSLGLLRPEPLP